MDQEKAKEMYEKLLAFAEDMHEDNRKRIHNGIVFLFVLPVILLIVQIMTDSSRILFLMIWIASMFALVTYLIYVAYADYQLKTMLKEILDVEKEYDDLMGYGPEIAQERFKERHEKFQKRVENIRELVVDRIDDIEERFEEVYEEYNSHHKK